MHPSRPTRLLLFVALPVYLLAFAILRPDRDAEMMALSGNHPGASGVLDDAPLG